MNLQNAIYFTGTQICNERKKWGKKAQMISSQSTSIRVQLYIRLYIYR